MCFYQVAVQLVVNANGKAIEVRLSSRYYFSNSLVSGVSEKTVQRVNSELKFFFKSQPLKRCLQPFKLLG